MKLPDASGHSGAASAGWILLLVLLAYTGCIHHGIGPVRDPLAFAWYQPRGFLFRWSSTDWLTEELRVGMVGLLLPALALALTVWFTLRSAVARLLVAWSVLCVALFIYYGIQAPEVWRFFHWRGSAVMLLLALVGAVALASPWLAAAWSRLAWPWRLALYVPAAFGALWFMRNATGTDPSLTFALSPWPVVPVFGLELVVPVVCLVVSLVAVARVLARDLAPVRRLLISVVAAAAALVLVQAMRDLGFGIDWKIPALACCLAAAALLGAGSGPLVPGRNAALGVLLLAPVVLLGLALVERDYTYTRDHRAAQITAALEAYAQERGEYPESLEELVEAGLLSRVPLPRVGFRAAQGPGFVYQNFGISYLLEFSTPRWVQCAYNPPYLDEEEDWEQEDGEGEDLPGSWSCPSKPPELW